MIKDVINITLSFILSIGMLLTIFPAGLILLSLSIVHLIICIETWRSK